MVSTLPPLWITNLYTRPKLNREFLIKKQHLFLKNPSTKDTTHKTLISKIRTQQTARKRTETDTVLAKNPKTQKTNLSQWERTSSQHNINTAKVKKSRAKEETRLRVQCPTNLSKEGSSVVHQFDFFALLAFDLLDQVGELAALKELLFVELVGASTG